MSKHLRVGMATIGVSASLLAAVIGIAAIGAGSSAAAKPALHPCSSAGLRFTEKQEGVTYSVAVAGLKAKVATCPTARSVAATVAKDILHEAKVPTTIAGFKVTVKEPCAGCTPDTRVSARSGQELITFTVKGGA